MFVCNAKSSTVISVKGVNHLGTFYYSPVLMRDTSDITVSVLSSRPLTIDVTCTDWTSPFDKFVMSWGGALIFDNVVLLNMTS